MSGGILIDSKSVNQSVTEFDTRRPRLQVAVDRNPKHLDLIISSPGTALDITPSVSYVEETLFTLNHNLGYKPKVLVYFYFPNYAPFQGYAVGRYFYGFGVVDDQITYRVDEDKFYIIHTMTDNIGGATQTSTAPDFGKVQIKYLIFSNPVAAVTHKELDP